MRLTFSNCSVVGLMIFAAAVAASAQEVAPESCGCVDSMTAASGANQRSDTPVAPDDTSPLSQLLIFDSSHLAAAAPVKPLKLPTLSDPQKLAVTRSERPDGSSVVTVKQALSNEWSANIGADLGIGASPAETYRPERAPVETKHGNSGAAWASLGVTKFATIDARVDPANDQGQLGTTLKHSMPVGSYAKVTIQDAHSITEGVNAATGAAPTALSGSTRTDATARTNASQVLGNQQTAKLDLLRTGTAVTAALNSNSTDPLTHKSLSVDQKLMGPLHVTTMVTDVGQPTANKSIAAGFKLNW